MSEDYIGSMSNFIEEYEQSLEEAREKACEPVQQIAAVRAMLPTDSAARKNLPVATGVVDYFPDALAAVAEVSRIGNAKHNPGQPLHWSRGKSNDHADALLRHFIERGLLDHEGTRHSAQVAWRALAILQLEIEAARASADNSVGELREMSHAEFASALIQQYPALAPKRGPEPTVEFPHVTVQGHDDSHNDPHPVPGDPNVYRHHQAQPPYGDEYAFPSISPGEIIEVDPKTWRPLRNPKGIDVASGVAKPQRCPSVRPANENAQPGPSPDEGFRALLKTPWRRAA